MTVLPLRGPMGFHVLQWCHPMLVQTKRTSYCTRMITIYSARKWIQARAMHLPSANKAEPTLALKPRGDVTRSPKQGYQWSHKWTCVQQKFKKKKEIQAAI